MRFCSNGICQELGPHLRFSCNCVGAARCDSLRPGRLGSDSDATTGATRHRPYEFGVKVSIATPLRRCKGGQFVAHVAALPGNPYDGHTLAKVVPAITEQIGVSLTRTIADAGYRGHNAPRGAGLRVYTAGQKRGVTEQIKRELRRRSAVEPVIGHMKDDHRLGRNHLAD